MLVSVLTTGLELIPPCLVKLIINDVLTPKSEVDLLVRFPGSVFFSAGVCQ